MFNYISSNVTVTTENDNRKKPVCHVHRSPQLNQPPVIYPEVTVVVSVTSQTVVLMNGGVIFLLMRLFSFERGYVCCHADSSSF